MSEEIILDDDPDAGLGFLDVPRDNTQILDSGIEMEIDCPQCDQSVVIELPWSDIGLLALGKQVRNIKREQGGSIKTFAPCQQCATNHMQRGESAVEARRNSTSVVSISAAEVGQWITIGISQQLIPAPILRAIHARRQQQAKRRR